MCFQCGRFFYRPVSVDLPYVVAEQHISAQKQYNQQYLKIKCPSLYELLVIQSHGGKLQHNKESKLPSTSALSNLNDYICLTFLLWYMDLYQMYLYCQIVIPIQCVGPSSSDNLCFVSRKYFPLYFPFFLVLILKSFKGIINFLFLVIDFKI